MPQRPTDGDGRVDHARRNRGRPLAHHHPLHDCAALWEQRVNQTTLKTSAARYFESTILGSIVQRVVNSRWWSLARRCAGHCPEDHPLS